MASHVENASDGHSRTYADTQTHTPVMLNDAKQHIQR